jgi:chaperone required for assembly of F1-ATPase
MECKSFLIALALLSRYFSSFCSYVSICSEPKVIPASPLHLLCRRLTVSGASAAARVEEDFQTEIWGVVEGGHDMDILNNSVALAAVDAFLVAYTASDAAFRERLDAWRQAASSQARLQLF